MQILTGDTRSHTNVNLLMQHGWGRMYQESAPKPFPGEPWGFDNCAFLYYRRGTEFDADAYCRRLDLAMQVGTPYIAVVPDVVAGGTASLDFSWDWFGVKRVLPDNWPWYLAVQDGMSRRDVEGVIRGGWTGLFLGGTNRFKQQTAWMWRELAAEFGIKFHYGRAGTLKKVEHAKVIKADSLDSAFPLWTKERFARFIKYVTIDSSQLTLPVLC